MADDLSTLGVQTQTSQKHDMTRPARQARQRQGAATSLFRSPTVGTGRTNYATTSGAYDYTYLRQPYFATPVDPLADHQSAAANMFEEDQPRPASRLHATRREQPQSMLPATHPEFNISDRPLISRRVSYDERIVKEPFMFARQSTLRHATSASMMRRRPNNLTASEPSSPSPPSASSLGRRTSRQVIRRSEQQEEESMIGGGAAATPSSAVISPSSSSSQSFSPTSSTISQTAHQLAEIDVSSSSAGSSSLGATLAHRTMADCENELRFLLDEWTSVHLLAISLYNTFHAAAGRTVIEEDSSSSVHSSSDVIVRDSKFVFQGADAPVGVPTFVATRGKRKGKEREAQYEREREIQICYDEVMFQIRQLETKMKRLQDRIKALRTMVSNSAKPQNNGGRNS